MREVHTLTSRSTLVRRKSTRCGVHGCPAPVQRVTLSRKTDGVAHHQVKVRQRNCIRTLRVGEEVVTPRRCEVVFDDLQSLAALTSDQSAGLSHPLNSVDSFRVALTYSRKLETGRVHLLGDGP